VRASARSDGFAATPLREPAEDLIGFLCGQRGVFLLVIGAGTRSQLTCCLQASKIRAQALLATVRGILVADERHFFARSRALSVSP
jgi:hypothetical protein